MTAADRGNPRTLLLLLLLHLTITACFLPSPSLCDTEPDDAAVMQSLAKSLKPLPTGWSSGGGADPCGKSPKWDGVSCNSGRVTSINLQSSSITGTLPPGFNKLSSLQSLSLQKNQIAGDLPSFEGLSNLQVIYLGNNNFTSIPPGFFSGLTSLMNISLDFNPFSPWSIPNDLSQSTNLVMFSATNAGIEGPIPDFFGGGVMISLRTLRLSYNNLEGGLPSSFRSSGIQDLYLNNQTPKSRSSLGGLSGPIDVLGSMTQLSHAWLHVNNFSGPIPDLSNCTALVDLQLRDNSLTGIVPPLASLPLVNLVLDRNFLQGPMPSIPAWTGEKPGNSFCNPTPGPCDQRVTWLLSVAAGFGYPLKIAKSWTGNDPCSSNVWLFVSCDPQGNVISLNFANQKFTGSISSAIANFTSLKKINLSNNSLTGPIPESLTGLTQLQSLDVSNNNLTGKVPAFRPGVALISNGNPLFGDNTGGGGSVSSPNGSDSSSPSGNSAGESDSKKLGQIVPIVVGVLVFIMVFAGLIYYYCHWKRPQKFGKVLTHSPPNGPEMVKIPMAGLLIRNGGHASELNSQGSGEDGNAHLFEDQSMSMSIQDLRQSTSNFSGGNILGRGGFGVVYKGVRSDGTLIAVKRMECNEMGKKGMDEFIAEINVLRKVRHRHLVALLGYCMDGYERLLVYEYMPQGTLGQHLFGGDESLYPSLSWKQRLTIALDVAKGLEYLHSLAQESFIHRDLKPSNILLDNDMRAKVSDFGLVKLAPAGKNSVATRLAGTFGYLAPEYATTGKVTTKVDVYAFGVVLMELITGRKALDESLPEESSHLVTWFRRVLINKDNFRKAVDSSLDLDEETFSSVSKVAELAGHCTTRESHQRPDMGHAVNILAPLVDQWKPSGPSEEDRSSISFNESLSQRLKRWQNNEGTSTMGFDFNSHFVSTENTQDSIPTKLDMFPDGR